MLCQCLCRGCWSTVISWCHLMLLWRRSLYDQIPCLDMFQLQVYLWKYSRCILLLKLCRYIFSMYNLHCCLYGLDCWNSYFLCWNHHIQLDWIFLNSPLYLRYFVGILAFSLYRSICYVCLAIGTFCFSLQLSQWVGIYHHLL